LIHPSQLFFSAPIFLAGQAARWPDVIAGKLGCFLSGDPVGQG
jgi:hypothetical protein